MANDIRLPTKMSEFNSRIHSSPKSAVRRKRPRPTTSSACKTVILLLPFLHLSSAYTVTWNFGPEDHFFCGYAWDDANCSTRQNCRSGKSEECEGFARGETCYKDTPCDSATGGGHEFVEGMYDTLIPTFGPTILTPAPSGMPVTIGPTLIPTDVPIGPPPDFEYPSDDPSDHWFCGLGIDDANEKCKIHCPSASECPVGQICYFGTKCDARTHSPSPPPTHRPTKPPTMGPTTSPTITSMPTTGPTISIAPSGAPSMPQPTQTPTPGPTTSPTHGPLTDIQQGFFCATDWNDAITNCKMRCPSGEDPECPQGEFCFAYTGCTEEKGYPNGRPPMRAEGNSTSSEAEEEAGECLELKVVIVADEWPNELSWDVADDTGNVTISGINDKLVSGEAIEYLECLPKGCYEFTIRDSGGDGLCCDHGDGSYEIYFDGKKVKNGGTFYDYETTQIGTCGDTPAPSPAPKEKTSAPIAAMTDAVAERPGGGGLSLGSVTASGAGSESSTSSGSIYRCVEQDVDKGYMVREPLCSKLTNCYNEFIDMGDDWFCAEGEVCIESPGCGGNDEETADTSRPARVTDAPVAAQTTVSRPLRPATSSEAKKTPAPVGSSALSFVSAATPTPTPSPLATTPAPVTSTTEPSTLMTDEPTVTATTLPPSVNPTTSSPTLGPCDGEPCNRDDYCRSEHGFCGPNKNFCNEFSIWTIDCGRSVDTPSPSVAAAATSTEFPVAFANDEFSVKRPSGGGKGSGGGTEPATNEEPTTQELSTHDLSTLAPTGSVVTLPPTTAASGFSTFMLFGSQKETGAPTPAPEMFVTLSSESEVHMEFITEAPTPSPNSSGDIKLNSALLDTGSNGEADQTENSSETDEVVNEFECTGEPCEQDAWCRSAFGTCGPGFIYCNSQAVWTASCRLNAPVTTPKQESASEPEEDAATGDEGVVEAGSVAVPAPAPRLGTQELPKPTLPTIIDGTASVNQQAFSAHVATADLAEAETEDSNEDLPKEPEEPARNYPSKYDSPEYAKQWSEWAATVQSSAPRNHQYTIYFAVLSLSAMLFCA